MSGVKVNENEELVLISVLDELIDEALILKISEAEIVRRLLERFQLRADQCRSAVHLDNRKVDRSKKMFNSKAGP